MNELRQELQNKDDFNSNTYDEFNKKLAFLTDTNTKMTEQLLSLQNKFQVQNQMNQEKNLKIQELTKDNEKLGENNEKYIESLRKIEEKINSIYFFFHFFLRIYFLFHKNNWKHTGFFFD